MQVSKKLRLSAVGAALALGLVACGGSGAGGSSSASSNDAKPSDTTIGVAMPTQTSERWIADGNNVKKQLEDKGYKVDLQYANDDIPTQSQQLDQMITKGEKLLIVAAITSTSAPWVIIWSTCCDCVGMSSFAYCRSTLYPLASSFSFTALPSAIQRSDVCVGIETPMVRSPGC